MNYSILKFLTFCSLLGQNIMVDGADQVCGFVGLDSNRPDNPHLLNPISDFAEEREALLTLSTYSSKLTGTISDAEGHSSYLGAAFSGGTGQKYYIRGNAKSKDFTRHKKTRMIKRQLRLYCDDEVTSYLYCFEIPVLDMTPPEFDSAVYTFDIGADWDRTRPISRGQIIIVSDNAYEISEINPDLLQFTSVPAGSLRIEKFPLWVFPYPERYYYRLDIYIEDGVVLEAGTVHRYTMSVQDEFNTGAADIVINVS